VFTFFLPGIETASVLPRLPALERLLARGRMEPLEGSPWSFLAGLAGADASRWPVGPVSALGELEHAPRACLRVEPLGADPDQHAMFRLPAAGLGIDIDEALRLAGAFRQTFGADGLRLEVATPERWYLAWEAAHPHGATWRGFPGPTHSSCDGGRPSPPELALRRLLSEVELLFHAHAVNTSRRDRGAPIIAGLHPWGGGILQDAALPATAAPAASARTVAEEPYLAGLRRLGVIPGVAAARADTGGARVDGVAWPLAVETLGVEQVQHVEEAWASPMLRMLNRGRLHGVRIVTGRAIHESRRSDALRVWRRPRPVTELC
jgi:hypothetical protein